MNFNDLYNRVFITEENDRSVEDDLITDIEDVTRSTDNTTPIPDNYTVEPLPPMKVSDDTRQLNTYIDKFKEFLNTLNGIEQQSLQSFVNDIDKGNSLLQGISKTSGDITRLAENTAALIQTLQSFISSANKRKRELTLAISSR